MKWTISADLQCISPAASERGTVNSSDVQRSCRFFQHSVVLTVQYGDNSRVLGYMNRLVGKHTNTRPGFMNNATETGQFPLWCMITVLGPNQSRLVFYV